MINETRVPIIFLYLMSKDIVYTQCNIILLETGAALFK